MADHQNVVLYRHYVERLTTGDIDAVTDLIAEDVVWREPGGEQALLGRESLLAQMRWVLSHLEIGIDVHDVLANDEHTVALIDWSMRSGEREVIARMVEIWHISHDQVKERWLFVEDMEAFLGFFTALAGSDGS